MTDTDRLVATARRAGPLLRRAGLEAGLVSRPARLLRRRLFRVGLPELDRILDALEDATIPYWLAGGWGVDALVGHETRPHADVDLCIDTVDADRAHDALAGIGYRVTAAREAGGLTFPVRTVARDDRGRTIDMLHVRRGADHALDPATGLELPHLDEADVTVGRLDGRPVPCLGVALQIDSHQGYAHSRSDRLDLRRLGVDPGGGLSHELRRLRGRLSRFRTASALYVRVEEAEGAFDAVGAADLGLPPHVTVLFPFLPPASIGADELTELRDRFAGIRSTTVIFDRLCWFAPEGETAGRYTLYLAPTDPTPFLAMTDAVVDRWPECPPYAGEVDSPVPHLTVPATLGFDEARRIIEPMLPIESRVSVVELAVRDPWSRWTTRTRFPLGGRGTDDGHD